MNNSVLALRQQQIAVARREYKARGSRLTRCDTCLLAQHMCICHSVSVAHECKSAVCLIMYHNESFKPSNTGRLIADIVPDNYAFRWDRTAPDPKLLELLKNTHYYPVIVFPVAEDMAEYPRVISKVAPPNDKIPLYIFLDGTWREAKKMFRKSPYLDALPILSIAPESLSDYKLRVAAHDHQLGTAEVASVVFEENNELEAAQKLTNHFIDFRDAYLRCKRKKL